MARVVAIASGLASLIGTATAGACNAADQANLADAKNVGDKQDACGKSALGLTGIDHDKFTSCVQSDLSISAGCSECYYATAQYGFANCKLACLAGWCKSGCLSCTQPAQDTLATCAGFTTSKADPCDDEVAESAMGACNAADQANLADAKNVGDKQDACGKSALGLTGIDHDKFTSCVQSDLSISAGCSECYYATAQYGFANCKLACLAGWCKSGCLSCTQPAQDTLATCAGFTTSKADPCDDEVAESAMGACNAADQANLADAKNVGDKQDACGKSALGLTGIDHDKFTSCVQSDLSISAGCSECYYATAQYGFANCKLACLAGWCKSGCLSCTQPAQDTLATCAGFTTSKADPCDDMVV